jgi:hypothetical protein
MTAQMSGLTRVGGVVVLTGEAVLAARDGAIIAMTHRRLSRLPDSSHLAAIAQACADAVMAADGQSDVPEPVVLQHFTAEKPTVPLKEAAKRLRLSDRQTRRLAPQLGGKKFGNRWFLDEQALREHLEGKWTEQNSCAS